MKKYKCNGRPSDDLDLTDMSDVIYWSLVVVGVIGFISLVSLWG